jgi:hypothetical protein
VSVLWDYALQLLGATGLLGAALAAFLWVPVPFKRPALFACLGLAVGILVYNAGYRQMQSRCEEATARFQVEVANRDKLAALKAKQLEDALKAATQKHAEEIDQKVSEYEKLLAARKEGDTCRLSPDDVDRLRSLD